MRCSFAPMEGLTGPIFRTVHYRFFPGMQVYYTPFLAPSQGGKTFTERVRREILTESPDGVPLIPQILTANPEDFLSAARELAELGFEEVNLNAGCPSGTVVSKGKGAAMLASPEKLDRFLDAVFKETPVRISIKTRLGLTDPSEFNAVLPVLERYPFSELILHPRTRVEMYKGLAHRDVFSTVAERTTLPLCYNGDIRTAADALSLAGQHPALCGVMVGRGAVANPAIFREIQGGQPLNKEELLLWYNTLFTAYVDAFGSHNAMHRMKEVWACLKTTFAGSEKIAGKIARSKSADELSYWAGTAFATLPLAE